MGSRGRALAAFAVALALAVACAAAAQARGFEVLWLRSANHTSSARGIKSVDRIVIHVTEGSFWGSVRWLRNHRSHGSSHYVISQGGDIVQLVSTSDVAWHAGNRWVNLHSIGIEHEGFTRHGRFTEAEYEASAKLVAYLAARARMPLDRGHVIGHDEVPNPAGRGLGGIDHHVDPGARWDWGRYMALVRAYSRNPVKPAYTRRIPRVAALPVPRRRPKPVVVGPGAVVKGVALWDVPRIRRLWGRGIYRVEFFVDGKLRWRDRVGPFAFARGRGWDTRTVPNGRHMLTAKVYGRGGYRMQRRYPVRVANEPVELALQGVAPDAGARGDVTIDITPSYPITRVVLYVDGKPVSRDGSSPYRLSWDSTAAAEGPHELLVYGRTAGGRRAARLVPVVVANASDLPPSVDLALDAPLDAAIALP
ncbi:MAG TPA: N-acetylmuramoyl-L-alanine amidase [Gaiellaceae bacterium]|nr:N-acetylmuramoyl-L-alanine amidase [Gaiellaceae bacterium]